MQNLDFKKKKNVLTSYLWSLRKIKDADGNCRKHFHVPKYLHTTLVMTFLIV